jgi:hypothetical protein
VVGGSNHQYRKAADCCAVSPRCAEAGQCGLCSLWQWQVHHPPFCRLDRAGVGGILSVRVARHSLITMPWRGGSLWRPTGFEVLGLASSKVTHNPPIDAALRTPIERSCKSGSGWWVTRDTSDATQRAAVLYRPFLRRPAASCPVLLWSPSPTLLPTTYGDGGHSYALRPLTFLQSRLTYHI